MLNLLRNQLAHLPIHDEEKWIVGMIEDEVEEIIRTVHLKLGNKFSAHIRRQP